jgi:aspartyl-tRNA synthetase
VCRDAQVAERLMTYPLESVVQVQGKVQKRKQQAKSASGDEVSEGCHWRPVAAIPQRGRAHADQLQDGPHAVEVEITSATLLNPAEASLPFYPNRADLVSA